MFTFGKNSWESGGLIIYSGKVLRPTYGAFPLQRGARFKRAVSCRARFWLRFHSA